MATRENLISDTVWELCNKLMQQARTGQSVCVEFKENTIMLYIKNALETLSDKEIEEVFENHFGVKG